MSRNIREEIELTIPRYATLSEDGRLNLWHSKTAAMACAATDRIFIRETDKNSFIELGNPHA